ncbi:MAG: hypothetical protein ACREQV_10125 [Candidatus Binatia bacterium]
MKWLRDVSSVHSILSHGIAIATAQDQGERIAAVDAAEVRRVATKYLDPERVAIIVVGKASEIEDSLRGLEHPVGLYDIEGRAVSR